MVDDGAMRVIDITRGQLLHDIVELLLRLVRKHAATQNLARQLLGLADGEVGIEPRYRSYLCWVQAHDELRRGELTLSDVDIRVDRAKLRIGSHDDALGPIRHDHPQVAIPVLEDGDDLFRGVGDTAVGLQQEVDVLPLAGSQQFDQILLV